MNRARFLRYLAACRSTQLGDLGWLLDRGTRIEKNRIRFELGYRPDAPFHVVALRWEKYQIRLKTLRWGERWKFEPEIGYPAIVRFEELTGVDVLDCLDLEILLP
jgi:hypothetical protein